jgi:hypothetical protein
MWHVYMCDRNGMLYTGITTNPSHRMRRHKATLLYSEEYTQRDPSIPVTVQIRGVTTGLPNDTLLAEKVIAPSEIDLGAETKVVFDDPFYAEADTSYAVGLLTNSTNYKVRTATLGKTGRHGITTRQTYAEGVLLESSNAETRSPLNGSDLTMRLYGFDF